MTARLREAKAEHDALTRTLALEKERRDFLARLREEDLRRTMQYSIDTLQERLDEAQRESRSNRAELERYKQYYHKADDARRYTQQALEVVFAMLTPGMPANTLLDVLGSVGKELLGDRLSDVRPILIDGLAEGARAGIPLYAKRKEQEKKENEKRAKDALSEAGFLVSLLGEKHIAASGGIDDPLGALLGGDYSSQSPPLSENCGRPDCPSCGGR